MGRFFIFQRITPYIGTSSLEQFWHEVCIVKNGVGHVEINRAYQHIKGSAHLLDIGINKRLPLVDVFYWMTRKVKLILSPMDFLVFGI